MQYYTYILKSKKDNSYYIGYTQVLIKRIKEHNKGLSKFTKSRRFYILVFKKEFKTRKEAIKYERYLKSLKKRMYLEKIISSSN
jgi:putative endonuclease